MAMWERVVATTTSKFVREVEDNTMRERKLLAYLKNHGNIKTNQSGKNWEYRIKFNRAPLQGYADADTLLFPRRNRHKVGTLEWRGYVISESCTEMEVEVNKGTEAIIKIFENLLTDIGEDMEDGLCDKIYIDGQAAGNSKEWEGLETALGATTTTGAGGKTRDPSDTYAGLSTALGAFGGSWTGDWPDGSGDAAYDAHSPVLIDSDNAAWGSSPSFAAYGDDQIRFGILKAQARRPSQGRLDMVLMTDTMWTQFAALVESKEHINTNRGNNSLAIKLGFDAINYDGADIMWEFGVPADTAYGLNTKAIKLRTLFPRLWKPGGPDFRRETKSYLVDVTTYSNFQLNPRTMFKIAIYA